MERPAKPPSRDGKVGEQAPADLGRALKTVYDDTLREAVPADFLDLLDKLD
uniref:NepR family anti-sigma factor n=1 Tax=uncultured Sphingomonas sp. TaxID=158754 RepID=UPI0025F9BA55|nr:NepR family anti-sigma factor [uncultured Sphingomonas sp.]